MNKYDIAPCGHVSPYKRIMIGHDDPVRGEEDKEDDIKKCVRLLEEKRVWDLVVQSSSGSPIPAKVERGDRVIIDDPHSVPTFKDMVKTYQAAADKQTKAPAPIPAEKVSLDSWMKAIDPAHLDSWAKVLESQVETADTAEILQTIYAHRASAAKKLFDGFAVELQKRWVSPLLPRETMPAESGYVRHQSESGVWYEPVYAPVLGNSIEAKPDLKSLDWTRLAETE